MTTVWRKGHPPVEIDPPKVQPDGRVDLRDWARYQLELRQAEGDPVGDAASTAPTVRMELPYRGECGICGCDDQRHREVDAWAERVLAGDDEQQVADDHGVPVIAVQAAAVATASTRATLAEEVLDTVPCHCGPAWYERKLADSSCLHHDVADTLSPWHRCECDGCKRLR